MTVRFYADEDELVFQRSTRQSALDLAMRACEGPVSDVISAAACIEAFLLEHPASGEKAFDAALTIAQRRLHPRPLIVEVLADARQLVGFLSAERPYAR